MLIRLWGVRGSLPSPKPPSVVKAHLTEVLRDFIAAHPKTAALTDSNVASFLSSLPAWKGSGYGGDTSCVEVEAEQGRLVIDAGSGLRRLGEKLMKGSHGKGQGEVHMLFTHFHWDHIVGLPFFTPIFVPGNKIHLYAVQGDLEANVRQVFKKPFFPVPFEALTSTITFHKLEPRVTREIAGFKVTPYQLDHPDPCWGYRVEGDTPKGARVYAHCVDNEATRISPLELGEDAKLYKNADLCFFDAQYTLEEFLEHVNWGHSAAPIGFEIALREGVKRIVFAHHDPSASDQKIGDAEKQTAAFLEAYRSNAKKVARVVAPIEWQFAHDGDEFEL